MKTNYRQSFKVKDMKHEELERREGKLKAFKAERKEKHNPKNQRIHQFRFISTDEDL